MYLIHLWRYEVSCGGKHDIMVKNESPFYVCLLTQVPNVCLICLMTERKCCISCKVPDGFIQALYSEHKEFLSLLPARVPILLSTPSLLLPPYGEFSWLTGSEWISTSDNAWHNGSIRKPLSNLLDFSSALFFRVISCDILPSIASYSWPGISLGLIYYWHSSAPPTIKYLHRTTSQDLRW